MKGNARSEGRTERRATDIADDVEEMRDHVGYLLDAHALKQPR